MLFRSIENAKALIEGISKQICKEKGISIADDVPFNRLVKTAFMAIGYPPGEYINVISGSLSAIAQQIGNLRSELGSTAHGKTIDELKSRNENMDSITKDFLIGTVEVLTCFLIRNYENENPRKKNEVIEETIDYSDSEEFNEFWDIMFGEYEMGSYSYPASEILFYVDNQAYVSESKAFIAAKNTGE